MYINVIVNWIQNLNEFFFILEKEREKNILK